MKKILSFIVISALLVVSCAKEIVKGGASEKNLVETVLHVGMEAKTSLGEGNVVLWDAGDKLSVLDGTGNNYTFTAQSSGASVDFVGDAPEGSEMEGWVAYYASNSGAKYDGTTLSAPVPYSIAAASKIYGRMAGIIGADNTVEMKQVGGLLSFEITTSNIISVTLIGNNGEHLAGKFNVTFKDGLPVTATPKYNDSDRQEQHGSVVMTPAEGAFAPGTYYIPVPATEFANGITLRFTRSDDKLYSEKVGTTALTVSRATIKPLGAVDASLRWGRQVHFSVADYKDCAKGLVWPFTEGKDKYTAAGSRKEYITSKEGLSFFISLSDNGNAWGAVGANAQGLKFGNSADDYLELPSIEGYGLERIVLTSGSSSKDAVTLYIKNATTGTTVTDSEWTNSVGRGTVKEWNINDTDGDTFQIKHNEGKYCCIQKLDLYYTNLLSPDPVVKSVTTVAKTCEFVSAKGAEGTCTVEGSMVVNDFPSEDFACGFQYRVYGTTAWTSVDAASALSFSATLTGLTDYERYEYRAWAKPVSGGDTKYGDVCVFTISDKNGGVRLDYTMANKNDNTDDSYYKKFVDGGYIPKVSTKVPPLTEPVTFQLPSDKDQILSFAVFSLSANGYGYRTTSTPTYIGLCISYNSEANAYLKLPAVPGWSLYGLQAIFVDTGTTFNVSSSVDGTTLAGDCAYKESTTTTGKHQKNAYISLTELGKTPITGDVYICGTSKAVTVYSLHLRYQVDPE